MATSGTTYTIDIPVQAGGVEAAAAQVARLASSLDASKSAAAQAAEAVRGGEVAYRAAEAAADRTAKALEKVSASADVQREKLRAAMEAGDAGAADRAAAALAKLTARQDAAGEKAREAKSKLDEHTASLAKLNAEAELARQAELKLSEAFDVAEKAAKEAATAAKKAAGTGEMKDALEGVAKLSGPLGGTVNRIKEATEGFGKLAKSMGSAGLYIGIAAAITAVAIGVAAVSAAAVAGIAKVTLWAVNLADKQGVIKSETDRLKKGFESLFSGLKISKLTDNFSRIVDLFDETNASGRAIKVVFESLFQPIVDGVANFLPKIRTAFLQFQILALKALIAIKPYGSTILTVVKVLGVLGAVLAGVVLVAVGAVAASLGVMALAFAAVVTAVAAVVAGVVWLGVKLFELASAALGAVSNAFSSAMEYLRGIDLTQIGTDMLNGLINGILGAGPAVVKAVTGAVGGAIDAAKKALGIASPSKVFAEIGGYTAEGMAEGVDAGAGDVHGSLESMVAPPAAPTVAGGGAAAPVSAGGNTYYVTVQAPAGDAGSIVDAFVTWFEQSGIQGGVAVPNG